MRFAGRVRCWWAEVLSVVGSPRHAARVIAAARADVRRDPADREFAHEDLDQEDR